MTPPRVIPKGSFDCKKFELESELRCLEMQDPEVMTVERLFDLRKKINEMIVERVWDAYTEKRENEINRAFFNKMKKWVGDAVDAYKVRSSKR